MVDIGTISGRQTAAFTGLAAVALYVAGIVIGRIGGDDWSFVLVAAAAGPVVVVAFGVLWWFVRRSDRLRSRR